MAYLIDIDKNIVMFFNLQAVRNRRLNTEQVFKMQGHATFDALCWYFCVMMESQNNKNTTVDDLEKYWVFCSNKGIICID